MHHTEKEIVDIVSKHKSDLDRMFSKLTLRFLNKIKSYDMDVICKADSIKALAELRRAYNICIECNALDQDVVNTICNQIQLLEEKYGKN